MAEVRYLTTASHISRWRDQNERPSRMKTRLNRSGSSLHRRSIAVCRPRIEPCILRFHLPCHCLEIDVLGSVGFVRAVDAIVQVGPKLEVTLECRFQPHL